eukprot:1963537-Amphidinium_carterae.1
MCLPPDPSRSQHPMWPLQHPQGTEGTLWRLYQEFEKSDPLCSHPPPSSSVYDAPGPPPQSPKQLK